MTKIDSCGFCRGLGLLLVSDCRILGTAFTCQIVGSYKRRIFIELCLSLEDSVVLSTGPFEDAGEMSTHLVSVLDFSGETPVVPHVAIHGIFAKDGRSFSTASLDLSLGGYSGGFVFSLKKRRSPTPKVFWNPSVSVRPLPGSASEVCRVRSVPEPLFPSSTRVSTGPVRVPVVDQSRPRPCSHAPSVRRADDE